MSDTTLLQRFFGPKAAMIEAGLKKNAALSIGSVVIYDRVPFLQLVRKDRSYFGDGRDDIVVYKSEYAVEGVIANHVPRIYGDLYTVKNSALKIAVALLRPYYTIAR